MKTENVINTLRDDNEYYYGEGTKYLSNSNITTLLKNPKEFGVKQEKTQAMIMGNAIHEITFFGSTDLPTIEASSRNTNIYKNRDQDGVVLLQKEMDQCQKIADVLKQTDSASVLFDESNTYEEPMIKDLFGNGVLWKGKADILCKSTNKIIDLKSTSNIDSFASKAKLYNYDSQAWIYKELFGMDVMFFVIEKESHRMKIIEVSDETLERGRNKAEEAEQNYIEMFVEKTADPKQFVEYGLI